MMGVIRPRVLLLSGVVGLLFYVALYLNTEPWRVYGNDVIPLLSCMDEMRCWLMAACWIVPASLFFLFVASIGRHWRVAWLIALLYLPAFTASRAVVIEERFRISPSSCANHSGVWWKPINDDYDDCRRLPESTEFLDLLKAFWGDQLELNFARCPGYRLAGSQTGVVFVGGGLLPDSLRDQTLLIAFCSAACHPPPHDHQHCILWSWGEVNGKPGGIFYRECTDAAGMIQKIEQALQQAASGLVPYSPDAQALLRAEQAVREEALRLQGGRRVGAEEMRLDRIL